MAARTDETKGVAGVLAMLSRALAVVGGIAVFLMMIHVSADVLSKYIFNRPIVGTLEIVSHYYMVAAIFLPLAAIERTRGHIFVELFTLRLPPRVVLALDAFACLLGAVFAGMIAWRSTIEALRRTRSGEMIDAVYYQILVWPTRWLVPLGTAVFMLMLLQHTARYAAGAFGRVPPAPPPRHTETELEV